MSRVLLVLAIGGLTARPASAARGGRDGAPAEPSWSGGIEQLVGGGERLFAIRDGTILTFDDRGSPIGRCGRPGPVAARTPPRPTRLLDAADVLQDVGLPDDDSTLEAEDALDEEGRLSRPAPVTATLPPARPRALAAAAARAWAATSDGLMQVTPGGCRRVALPGRDLIAVAASGSTLAAASADLLFRADARNTADRGDEAPRFRAIAALPARPRGLAIDATGAILVAGQDGLARIDAAGDWTRLLDRPARALAACGETVAALAGGGVYVWDGRRLARTGEGPPARLLACDDDGRRWIAAGDGVWSSRDAVSWTAHPAALVGGVTALAALGGRAWIGGDDGLSAVSLDRDEVRATPADATGAPAAEAGPVTPRRALAAPPSWVWPEVGALVTADRTAARRTVTALLVLRFPFDRPPPLRGARSGDLAALAGQLARRDAALAQAQRAATAGATTAPDAVDRDELAARREMATDERDALR
ncbi:MAG TPA: hypothetical protein VHM31_15845 [Polyangia bacterium]|nr:hypothetical protein [Polyangia bacterium]